MNADVPERDLVRFWRKENPIGSLRKSKHEDGISRLKRADAQVETPIVGPGTTTLPVSGEYGISESSGLSSSIVAIQARGFKPPLFCIHAGGGDVVFYAGLSAHLGKDQPFYGIQAKGLDGAELPFKKMEEMASFYIREIRKICPDGPYQLAGYCLGGRIAFEMAQQLTAQGHEVAFLANLNGISPTYGRVSAGATDQHKIIRKNKFTRIISHLGNIQKLSLKEKGAYVLKRLKMQVLGEIIGPFYLLRYKVFGVIFKLYISAKKNAPQIIAKNYVIQSLYMLQCNYKPKAYTGNMHVFTSAGMYKDASLGWKDFVGGKINNVEIAGEHHTRRDMMNEPYVTVLAKEIKNLLN